MENSNERNPVESADMMLTDQAYPIQVIARRRPVEMTSGFGEPIAIGYLQPESSNDASATVYFNQTENSYTSFAILDLPDNQTGEEAAAVFSEVGYKLIADGKAIKLGNTLMMTLPGHTSIVCVGLVHPQDPNERSHVYIVPRETQVNDAVIPMPDFIHVDEQQTSEKLITEIGTTLSVVINEFYLASYDGYSETTMYIDLPLEVTPEVADETEDIVITEQAVGAAKELVRLTNRLPEHVDFPSFDDFGGLDKEIATLRDVARGAFISEELLWEYDLKPQGGVLLVGPGGVGKTGLIQALAKEMRAHLQTVKAGDILAKYVGEPIANLREVFAKASASGEPTIVFFDEIDGIFSTDSGGNSGVSRSLISEFKGILNDVSSHPSVLVAAAANDIERIPEPVLRAGRFDTKISIGIPSETARTVIWSKLLYQHPDKYDIVSIDDVPADPINSQDLSKMSEGMSGVDIKIILDALRRNMMLQEARTSERPPRITRMQIEEATRNYRRGN